MSHALSSVGSLVGGIFGGPVGAAAGNLVGGLLGGGSNSGARGPTGSQIGANNAANQLYGGVNSDIGNVNDVGQMFQQRYASASPMEQQVLSFLYNQAFPGAAMPGTTAAPAGPTNPAYNQVPMMQKAGVNGGQPFAGWASRKNIAGATVVNPAHPAPYGAGMGAAQGTADPNAISNAVLGIYNSEPYRLARQAAEGSIDQNAINLGHDYANNLLGRGMQNSSLMTGGQANIVANAGKSFSDFARNLGINAVNEENNRVQQLNQALQPSLNSLGSAGSAYESAGQLGQGMMGALMGQSNTLNQAAGQAQISSSNALGQLGQQVGKQGGGSTDSTANIDPNTGAPVGAGSFGPPDVPDMVAAAHGAFLPAGQTTLTGERGAETFVPARGKEGTINIPHSIFAAWLHHTMTGGKQQEDPALALITHLLTNMPRSGGPTVVGAHGPEVIVPRQNGYVIPHSPADMTDQSAASLSRLDPIFMQLHQMYSGRS